MDELITIRPALINGVKVNSVDARELHRVLESKFPFAGWVQLSLDDVDARENIDYIILYGRTEKGCPLIEYLLSTDVAKDIALLERNKIGKKVRRYFIEVEKAYKQRKDHL